MARAQHKRAAKDYPQHGIAKGDMYWFAEVKTGPRSSITIRSKTPIPRSRLTASEFLSTAYDLSDRLTDASSLEELNDLKGDFENLRDETQEKLDNMPEGLQQGSTGELLQERIDQIESLLTEIESAIEEAKREDESDSDEDEQSEADRVKSAVENHITNGF
jgi:uncharacterized phage infection (PIP) family protein YhgE